MCTCVQCVQCVHVYDVQCVHMYDVQCVHVYNVYNVYMYTMYNVYMCSTRWKCTITLSITLTLVVDRTGQSLLKMDRNEMDCRDRSRESPTEIYFAA